MVSYTRAQSWPAAETVAVSGSVAIALSLATEIRHDTPVQLPRLRPTTAVLSAPTAVSVAWTAPLPVARKGWVVPPFGLRVPSNDSVTI